jgi:CheY-like chemotaxis protein
VLNQSLSLSLQHVRSVAEQHGGYFEHEINHHSVSFIVTLPRASLTPPPPTASRKLVVVVDDDVELQEFLCTALERHGYRVIGVNDGFDALIAIERYRPDIVISDVIMPNMSGLDLTSRVKQSMDLPVILVTGYYKDLAGLKQADHKPDMILSKPLEQERIVAAIETLTAKRHLSLLNLD